MFQYAYTLTLLVVSSSLAAFTTAATHVTYPLGFCVQADQMARDFVDGGGNCKLLSSAFFGVRCIYGERTSRFSPANSAALITQS
jgi:hypothetical protein